MKRSDGTSRTNALVSEGLLSFLGRHACETPKKSLVETLDRRMTYRQGYRLALDLTRYFLFNLRLTPGSTIVMYLTNLTEIPSILAASQAVGLRMVLRSPSLLRSCILEDVSLVNPSIFVVKEQKGAKAIREAGFEQEIIMLDGEPGYATPLNSISSLVGDEDVVPYMADPSISEIVLFTSGSTGQPKGIVNKMSSFTYNAFYLTEGLGITSQDILYAPIPVFHVYGLVSLFAVMVRGLTWAALPSYEVEKSLSIIEKTCATVYFCVPTILFREMREDREHPHDLSSLRLCMVAGDSCPKDVLIQYEEKYGCKVVLSYGMTETAATLTVENPDAPLEVRVSSNGPTIAGVSMAVDLKNSELLVKTPSFMVSVLSGDADVRMLDADGWFHTGDTGYLDDEGRVYVTGRIKNIIVRGGANIYPAKVENACRECPGVKDCAVVGYPSLEYGEKICLFVVPDGTRELTLSDIRADVKNRIEKGSAPDKLIVIDAIPTLPNNKRDNKTLKKIASSSG